MFKKVLVTVLTLGALLTSQASDTCERAKLFAAIGKACAKYAVEYKDETCYSIGELAVEVLQVKTGMRFDRELRNGLFLLCSASCDMARTKGEAFAYEKLDAAARKECNK